MEFTVFLRLLTKLKEIYLAPEKAHAMMAPPKRIAQLQLLDLNKINPKPAAVLLFFYPSSTNQVTFVLIKRKTYKGPHSGQISFPGGKPESQDIDLWNTALREASEEVGISESKVVCVRSLSPLYVPPSNFLITPFVGYALQKPSFTPEESEVEEIIEVPLDELINRPTRPSLQQASDAAVVEVPSFYISGHDVWGATAMILSEFKMLLAAETIK